MTAPTDIRQVIADQVQRDTPEFATYTCPKGAPDGFSASRPAQVSVFRAAITNAPTQLSHGLTVELITGTSDEDTLDDYLEAVLLSLQRVPGITWSEARRTTFDTKWAGYQISVTAVTPHIYREIIASEGAL